MRGEVSAVEGFGKDALFLRKINLRQAAYAILITSCSPPYRLDALRGLLRGAVDAVEGALTFLSTHLRVQLEEKSGMALLYKGNR